MAKVLILCPTFDHADTLYISIASVRAQTFADWEMAVIGDGAPERSYGIAEALTAADRRIVAYRHPKSERFGEIYRDPVIRASNAEFVCHLSDDDIWVPDHLAQMVALLERGEWVNQATLRLTPEGVPWWWPFNLGTAAAREGAARRVRIGIGINYVGYRRDAYLRLPEGWTCAPREAGDSDKFMWAKFFRLPDLQVASTAASSAIKFPSRMGTRLGRTPEQRVAEISPWLARAAEPGLADGLRRSATIHTRMIMLFALHAAGNCNTLEEAMHASGLCAASEDARPLPALNGEAMLLPLTETQRREALVAWALVRAHAGPDGGDAAANAMLAREYGNNSRSWLQGIRSLARIAGIDAGLRATRQFCQLRPDAATAFLLEAELLRGAGRVQEAADRIEETRRRWPQNPAFAGLQKISG